MYQQRAGMRVTVYKETPFWFGIVLTGLPDEQDFDFHPGNATVSQPAWGRTITPRPPEGGEDLQTLNRILGRVLTPFRGTGGIHTRQQRASPGTVSGWAGLAFQTRHHGITTKTPGINPAQ
ncbi:hypothetical protein [Spirosoma rhododendri]|uniref:Uncharacterized protein n=1 Tax=Spirosoma rhododendri TaxID=2728024 RepID=A0A7L5DR89_9BACT|nr:hypothetical protein [Spirosoma rhododendri]QJD80112.1 hypothetical protein HH216_18110 [Spirosoma rhododendri]